MPYAEGLVGSKLFSLEKKCLKQEVREVVKIKGDVVMLNGECLFIIFYKATGRGCPV